MQKRRVVCWHGIKHILHVSMHRSAFRQVVPFLDYTSQFALQTGSAEGTSQHMHVAASLTNCSVAALPNFGVPKCTRIYTQVLQYSN